MYELRLKSNELTNTILCAAYHEVDDSNANIPVETRRVSTEVSSTDQIPYILAKIYKNMFKYNDV